MFSLQLSAEQIEFRDTVRDFANDVIKPVTLKADRLDLADRRLPMEVLDQASQMGLRALALAEDLGGVGADNLTCCLVVEELAVGDTDVYGAQQHAPTARAWVALAGPVRIDLHCVHSVFPFCR